MTSSLEDIKVLDLSRVAPGAYAGMILGDLGAEVIKIDAPYEPGARPAGGGVPPMKDPRGEREVAFHPHNRNKKSLVLNLRTDEARRIFYKLAEKADIILEGFRPGVVQRLGIDYETIRTKANPRIIYCSLSGYGQDGPYKELPGHDINYISIAGALGIIGYRNTPPVIPLNLIADYAAGSLNVVIGVLVALLVRNRLGEGQYVDIAMTDGVVSLLSRVAYEYVCEGVSVKRGEHLLNGAAPFYNVYKTKDGKYFSIGCIEPHFWENLCQAVGREDFIPHQYAQGEKRREIFAYFRQFFRTKNRDELFELWKDKNICIGKVYTLEEMFQDPQLRHREMVVETDHPSVGKVRQVGIPIKLSRTPGKIRTRAPLLGEHTDEVLRNLGYSRRQIAAWRQQGVVV